MRLKRRITCSVEPALSSSPNPSAPVDVDVGDGLHVEHEML